MEDDNMGLEESDGQISAEEEDALLKSDEDDDEAGMDADEEDNSVDDSDSEDELESRLIKEYIKILGLIDQNKYIYNNYIQLVDTAHKLEDLEKIRQSCELFSSVYPLAPEIWLGWLKIESSIATLPQEIHKVEELFHRALNDYYCPNVALEFAKFAYKSPNCDAIWDEVLTCYALHCMKGREFFILWRKYFDEKELPQSEKLSTIAEIYQKELQIPLYNMEESYIEFKVLYQKNQTEIQLNWDDIDKKYNRAKEQLKIMLPYEKELLELDSKFHQERISLYKRYINNVRKNLDEKLIQILYERMVTECCLNETCWIDYFNYLDNRYIEYDEIEGEEELTKFSIFSQTVFDIIDRALKNCTWSAKLHIFKIRLYEDVSYSRQELQNIFETALESGFQEPEPVVNLWLEYLSCLRRYTDFNNEEEVRILRNNFDFAWTSLGKQWGVLADCNCEILQLWGRIEYEKLNNPTKGRELWYTVMESADNATKSGLWIEFSNLEMKHSFDATRKIFQKALSYHNQIDDPLVIISAWLRFERIYGSLNHLKSCEQHCETILNQINENKKYLEKQQQQQQNKNDTTNKKDKNLKRKLKDKQSPSPKKGENKVENEQNPNEIASSSSSSFEKKLKTTSDNTTENNRENVSKEHENDEIDLTKDHLRIFLSNLDYNITEEEIRKELPELSIVSIDLIKSASGKGRGFGYAELASEDEVKKALTFDNRLIKGRPVYISSVLRDKEKRQKFKYSDKLEPTKLFVKGIPYDATTDELKSIFEKYGKLKDVRIVYHKSGKSKGIAYIEYENENSASIAVMKLDQYELRDHKLNVAISAPPPKSSKESTSSNMKKLLGVTKTKKPPLRMEQKPRMNLIPTSVRKLAQSQKNDSNAGQSVTSTVKTNEDFRKELLGLK